MNTPHTPSTPILFYGVPGGSSFGSIVALEWLGRPYRLTRIGMPEQVKSPAYAAINPLGETPSLRTADGRLISESAAILNHVNALGLPYGRGVAQGTPEFDAMNYALSFLNTTFYGAFAPLWALLEHGPESEMAAAALKDYGHAAVQKAHAALERLLEGRTWMAGDQRTVADAYFMGIARWLDYHQVFPRDRFPRVHALYERLRDDPAVRVAEAAEAGEPLPAAAVATAQLTLDEALALLPSDAR
ncbi:glutathione S-transferase family protein [Roseateles asaccharophilus]|uniref:Glutathione S-transferase n=1 Tax=Roseateles asaccharophilus TaxID=582607 RepID=A0ABU2A5V5_9BURK|nr:glutathione S-transferase family protein [Roseateles asaccharophilus]MDR7332586.1 glutathione S-transferase [Roseateles asaccharophilus]